MQKQSSASACRSLMSSCFSSWRFSLNGEKNCEACLHSKFTNKNKTKQNQVLAIQCNWLAWAQILHSYVQYLPDRSAQHTKHSLPGCFSQPGVSFGPEILGGGSHGLLCSWILRELVNCTDQYRGYYAQSLVFHKTVETVPAREGKVTFYAEI